MFEFIGEFSDWITQTICGHYVQVNPMSLLEALRDDNVEASETSNPSSKTLERTEDTTVTAQNSNALTTNNCACNIGMRTYTEKQYTAATIR